MYEKSALLLIGSAGEPKCVEEHWVCEGRGNFVSLRFASDQAASTTRAMTSHVVKNDAGRNIWVFVE